MTQVIINLARHVIEGKVEAILQEMPSTPCIPKNLQEELVSYTLKHMPSVYATVETTPIYPATSSVNCFSTAQQRRIDALIYEGLERFLPPTTSWQTAAQLAADATEPSPSHWFG